MKRIVFIFIISLSSFHYVFAQSYDFAKDGLYYNKTFTDNEVSLSYGEKKYSGNIVVPSTVSYKGKTYSVTSIGYNAFFECKELDTVQLPNTIKILHNHSFERAGLKHINIPNSVSFIGEGAFFLCERLTSLNIPNSVNNILDRAFSYCTSLRSVTLSNSLKTINDDLFAHSGITTITIPNSIEKIDWGVFRGCQNLETVNLPASLKSIGNHVFLQCPLLKEINVEEGNTYYSSLDGVLFDAKKETLIRCPEGKTGVYKVPYGVKTFQNLSFAACVNLTSIDFPSSLLYILDDVFVECGFVSITLPDSLTHFGFNTFCDCKNLLSITIPASVYSIGNKAFYGCTNLQEIHAKSATPVPLDDYYYDVFLGVPTQSCILYVPPGAKKAYESTPLWWDFKKIVEETTSDETVSADKINLSTFPDKIVLFHLDIGSIIEVFDLEGKLIYKQKSENSSVEINLVKNNIYIVRVNSSIIKKVIL